MPPQAKVETADDSGSIRLQRWPRPVLSLMVLVLVLAVGAGGLTLGYIMRSNTSSAIAAASKAVPVYRAAELQSLQLTPVSGTIAPVSTFDYLPASGAFTGQPVVTQLGPASGQVITPGSLLIGLDDQPVFALTLAITPWRDLTYRQSGSDVKSLNDELKTLGLRVGGSADHYDYATVAAVRALFEGAHFIAPGTLPGKSLPMANVAFLPLGHYVVSSTTPLGSVVASGKPAVQGSQSTNQITCKIDILHKQRVSVGTAVDLEITGGGTLGTGKIESIGPFTSGDSSKSGTDTQAGYPIVISFAPPPAGNPIAGGAQISIGFPGSTDRRIAVPTIAIDQTGVQPWVYIRHGNKLVRVNVTPVWQQGGWTAIQAEAIKAGDDVLVSAR